MALLLLSKISFYEINGFLKYEQILETWLQPSKSVSDKYEKKNGFKAMNILNMVVGIFPTSQCCFCEKFLLKKEHGISPLFFLMKKLSWTSNKHTFTTNTIVRKHYYPVKFYIPSKENL